MMGNQNSDSTASEAALQDNETREAYMFQNQFFPEGQFHVVSSQLEGMSTPAGAGEGQFLSSFTNRLIQYTNARNTFAFFFPYQDAEIEQGVLYRLGGDWEDIGEGNNGGGDTPTSNLINVTFTPVSDQDDGDGWFDRDDV
ncbi:hypothetical protein [Halorussus aquaticus]|uniref:Uncharacterized protein n=1 Tax=Halorussus aquaticus TaxID=2953748 RepID=A0ABD5Q2T1_9EURY|nr:hypothetical protein [Halorussus aquaticus]